MGNDKSVTWGSAGIEVKDEFERSRQALCERGGGGKNPIQTNTGADNETSADGSIKPTKVEDESPTAKADRVLSLNLPFIYVVMFVFVIFVFI